MNNALNSRLATLTSYYAEIDAEIALQARIRDTYEGMLSMCNDGEGADGVLGHLDAIDAEAAQLKCDRAEIDRMWNEALIESEGA